MEKIKSAFSKLWNSYKNWLGDVVWYKNWKVWFSVVVVLVIGAFGGTDEPETEAEPKEPETEEVVEKEEPESEEIEETEEEETEEVELTTEEKIKTIAEDVFGSKLLDFEYMDETNHYNIYTKTSGLSANMDRKSAYFSATDFLEGIRDEDFESVYLEYQAVFIDDFGNEEERKGIAYDVTKETVDKINFDSFLPEKLPDIVDSYWQHPAFN